MSILAAFFGLWWLATVSLLVGSTWLAARRRILEQKEIEGGAVPLSILVPLRSTAEADDAENGALATLDYPSYEILFSVNHDPAEGLPRLHLHESRGQGTSRVELVLTALRSGWNPKLANLVEPLQAANFDLVLIKDAATRLPAGSVRTMVAALVPGTGVVSAIPIARRPLGLAATVEAALINTYGARMLFALAAFGGGAGIGAVMLFRRADLDAAGGFEAIHGAIADDHALARLLGRQGLRSVLAGVVDQDLGARTVSAIWQRHLRWAICRRVEEPLTFLAELLTGAVAACLAAFLFAHAFALPWAALMLVTLLLWPVLETLLAASRGWPLSRLTPLAVVLREIAMPLLWLNAVAARHVAWGAASMPIQRRRR